MTCDPNMIIIDGPWPYVITTMMIAFGFILRGFFIPRDTAASERLALRYRELYRDVVIRARQHKAEHPRDRARDTNPIYLSDEDGRACIEQMAAINKRAGLYYPNVETSYRDWLKGEGHVFYIYGFPVLRDANRKVGL